ncbi:hypothetical protein BD769DRAFT_1390171 [Suillus cothurnatus]|nr:hypothetical protein BD769DRAFT_1390171 [Suillus cothurnatus]
MSESRDFNQDTIGQCWQIIEDFKKGCIQKGDTLLEIQSALQSAIAESEYLTQEDFKTGFQHFLKLLDHASRDEGFQPQGQESALRRVTEKKNIENSNLITPS